MSSGSHNQKKSLLVKLEKKNEDEYIQRYKNLVRQVQEARSQSDHSLAALRLTDDLLTQNTEFYTIWNYRREILKDNPVEIEKDLVFTIKLLKKSPKSYWIFNHRKWIVSHLDSKNEVGLVNMMLDLDARNFHGWDYRRTLGLDRLEEFHYTTLKLNQSFSNWSAWHYRSKLIHQLKAKGIFYLTTGHDIDKLLLKDLEMVRHAVYTDPNDQCAWLYQRWLLGEGNANSNKRANCHHTVKS